MNYLNVAQVAANLCVLGYGTRRAGVWTQGCTIGCPGCVSLHTHDPAAGRQVEPAQIIAWLRAQGRPVDGLTISGGEPTEQDVAVCALIVEFRVAFPGTDVLMFSGLPWRRLLARHRELTEACDVVIAGPYVKNCSPLPLRGSSNQSVTLLTELARERYQDFERWPVHSAQVTFGNDRMTAVGIPDLSSFSKQLANKGFNTDSASWLPSNRNGVNP